VLISVAIGPIRLTPIKTAIKIVMNTAIMLLLNYLLTPMKRLKR
jgi:hypothetical protein